MVDSGLKYNLFLDILVMSICLLSWQYESYTRGQKKVYTFLMPIIFFIVQRTNPKLSMMYFYPKSNSIGF